MQETKSPTRRVSVHSSEIGASPRGGLTLVDHHCPHCGCVSAAPVAKVTAGPLGMWSCEGCDQGFAVTVVMEPIDAFAQYQLIAVHGQQLLLKSRLPDLANGVDRLRSELD